MKHLSGGKWRKTWALVTPLVLTSGLVAGCGSAKAGDSSQKSSVVSLRIMENQSTSLPSPDQDIILKTLDQKLGVNITLNDFSQSTDYENQLNEQMAAGDFPDLFQVPDQNTLMTLQKQGVLLDLTPYLKKLGPTTKLIGDNLKDGELNGQVYAISKAPNLNYSTYWIRKDWLKKLGLQEPTTLSQLFNVAKAFTDDDPDGNGKKDTYGITGVGLSAFAPIFGAFGVGMPGDFYIKNGKLVNALFDPNMPKALAYIHTMVQAGVVDPSIMSYDGAPQVQEPAFEGKDGIMWMDWPNVMKDNFKQEWKKVNSNAQWVQLPAPKGPGGQYNGTYDKDSSSGMYAIPKSLAKDPAKLNKVFDLLNYVSKPAGNDLVDYGLAGRDYKMENGKIVTLPKLDEEGGYFFVYQFTGRPEQQYLDTKFSTLTQYIKFAADQPVIETVNGFINLPQNYNANDANTYITQEITNFIFGKQPLSQYQAFLNTLQRQYKYKIYLQSAQEQIQKLGMTK
jgi:putative aldouronate transport system substrate-binding protein